MEWDGHVMYCDPSRDPGTDGYALRIDGMRKCISNLVSDHTGTSAELTEKLMAYLEKAQVA